MLTWVAAVERSGELRQPVIHAADRRTRPRRRLAQRGSDLDLASDPG